MSDSHQIAMALRGAYLAMHRRTDAVLGRDGITADQFVLLSLLAEKDGVMQQELVRRASSDPNTIRAILVLLEEQGHLIRRAHPTDGRGRIVWLTNRGRRAFQRLTVATEPVRQSLAKIFESRGAEDFVCWLVRVAAVMNADLLAQGNSNGKINSIKQRKTRRGKEQRNVSTQFV